MRITTPQLSTRPDVLVNGVVITNATIAREVQNHVAPSPRQAWDAATRALVIRELLLQRANTLGIAAEPQRQGARQETQDEALIRAVLEAEVTTPTADEDVCRRYYHANLTRFRSPDLFEPLHILFRAAQADEAAYGRAVERAEAALAELSAAPSRFESLARAVSDCPSAAEGGRLGQVASGDTTAEFEAALKKLQSGEISRQPIRTRYGVHVVRLDRKIAGRTMPFEQVRDRIAAYLERASWRRAAAQYVSLLAGEATIAGFDMPGAASPLVQ